MAQIASLPMPSLSSLSSLPSLASLPALPSLAELGLAWWSSDLTCSKGTSPKTKTAKAPKTARTAQTAPETAPTSPPSTPTTTTKRTTPSPPQSPSARGRSPARKRRALSPDDGANADGAIADEAPGREDMQAKAADGFDDGHAKHEHDVADPGDAFDTEGDEATEDRDIVDHNDHIDRTDHTDRTGAATGWQLGQGPGLALPIRRLLPPPAPTASYRGSLPLPLPLALPRALPLPLPRPRPTTQPGAPVPTLEQHAPALPGLKWPSGPPATPKRKREEGEGAQTEANEATAGNEAKAGHEATTSPPVYVLYKFDRVDQLGGQRRGQRGPRSPGKPTVASHQRVADKAVV
ncbi:hypothetical protein HMPREF1624_08233 [Sporothrix schenckii ATCC 58251]|uniref:Uncharacterized protein n=1 Tax=Sporothrix schenckii (strain ATCC 58251 / de Perez 2211183) TaxID=1391915 RepID=U7PLE4_SPOS1|nr:hypothetical protein HMPREF1624_08233 [Sporothrix schenckii ATCC 58251]